MKISVSATNYSWQSRTRDHLEVIARRLDGSAVDTLWVPDHLMQVDPASRTDEPMLEAYTVLGFLAAATSRLRLGAMVSAATYRAPALLVKAVTTLDVLSDGRAWFGVGAGYSAEEAAAMGLFLPGAAERFERLAELLRLAAQMWRGDETPFLGTHVRLDRPVGSPVPATRPRPPILIGGTGARRTLRLVAEYADACNVFDVPDGGRTIRTWLAVLDRHCAEVGRPAGAVERTITTALREGESADELTARCGELGGYGLQHVVLIVRGRPWAPDDLDVVVAAADQVAGLVHTPG